MDSRNNSPVWHIFYIDWNVIYGAANCANQFGVKWDCESPSMDLSINLWWIGLHCALCMRNAKWNSDSQWCAAKTDIPFKSSGNSMGNVSGVARERMHRGPWSVCVQRAPCRHETPLMWLLINIMSGIWLNLWSQVGRLVRTPSNGSHLQRIITFSRWTRWMSNFPFCVTAKCDRALH